MNDVLCLWNCIKEYSFKYGSIDKDGYLYKNTPSNNIYFSIYIDKLHAISSQLQITFDYDNNIM